MVSVIIPSYNREKTIVEAIQSVLNQTYTDLEVIIVDDGSSDNTRVVIQSIHDSRVKYFYQENAGACIARNNGIQFAKGEYIAFHDSDDIWRKDKLEKQMRVLQESKADIVFCKLVVHEPNGAISYKPSKCVEGIVYPISNLFGIGTQTLLAHRYVFDKVKFDPEMPRFQEFELLYRATQKFSLYCLNEGLVDYYVGEDSISSNPQKLYLACNLLISKYPEITKKYSVMGKRMAQYLLSAAVREKNKENRKKYIKLALHCHKNMKLIEKSILIDLNFYK